MDTVVISLPETGEFVFMDTVVVSLPTIVINDEAVVGASLCWGLVLKLLRGSCPEWMMSLHSDEEMAKREILQEAQNLRVFGALASKFGADDTKQMFEVILTNFHVQMQQLGSIDDDACAYYTFVGPLLSRINHSSTVQNVRFSYCQHFTENAEGLSECEIFVYAGDKPIKKGDELCIDYGVDYPGVR